MVPLPSFGLMEVLVLAGAAVLLCGVPLAGVAAIITVVLVARRQRPPSLTSFDREIE